MDKHSQKLTRASHHLNMAVIALSECGCHNLSHKAALVRWHTMNKADIEARREDDERRESYKP